MQASRSITSEQLFEAIDARRVRPSLPTRSVASVTAEVLPPEHAGKVVPLEIPVTAAAQADGDRTDWAGSLQLVQDVSARTRTVRAAAHDAAARAEELAKRCVVQAEASEVRARELSERLGEAEARARSLRERLDAAEARANRADEQVAEAHSWLRRLHDCIRDEFTSLTTPA